MTTARWPLALAAVAVLSRLPFATQWPYAWDSILYIRALQRFDVVHHQPQPPGYIFYVGLAWLLNQVWSNPNGSLVALSILGTAWAAVALYFLGLHLAGQRAGIAAALILLASPTFWAYGEVAYPYTILAAVAASLALLVWWTRFSPPHLRKRRLVVTTLCYALMAGLRQDILLLLMPLYLMALWRRPASEWLTAAAVGTVGVLAWLAPSAYLSGGLMNYLAAVVRQSQKVGEASSLAAAGAQVLQENLRPLVLAIWHSLYLAIFPAIYLLIKRTVLRLWGPELPLLTLWTVPPAAFYTAVHMGDVGYSFSIVPALCLMAALGVEEIARDLSTRPATASALPWALALLLIGSNGAQFLLRPGTSPYSAQGLRCRDLQTEAKIQFVRSHFPAGPTVLLGVDTYQHTSYFLPDYWSYDKLAAHARLRERLPSGMQWAVVVDNYLAVKGHWELAVMPCGGSVRYRRLSGPSTLIYRRPFLALIGMETRAWKPN